MQPVSLSKIARHNGTDKSPEHHGYTKVYAKYFDPIRELRWKMVEIGFDKGYSAQTWLDYFPKIELICADILEEALTRASKIVIHKNQAFQAKKLDQSDRGQLEAFKKSLKGTYDVILDDGSHRNEDTQLTLGILGPKVKKGGYFIIEDLHTKRKLPEGIERTEEVLMRFAETGKFDSPVLTDKEKTFVEDKFEVLEIARGVGKNRHAGTVAILQKK